MAASDAIPVPRRNAAYRFYFAIRNPSDSTLVTGWTGADSEVSKDGFQSDGVTAGFTDCTNEATEIATSGTGYIDLTATEMNADCVVLKVTVTNTGAVPLVFTFYPETSGDYRIDPSTVAVEIGAEGGNLDSQIAAILTDTGTTIPAQLTSMSGATFDTSTDSLEAIRNRGDAAWTGGGGLTVGDIADAVWDESLAAHLTAGSTGEALNAAGSAGDPWITALPGSYTAGQAGYIVGTNIDAQISASTAPTVNVFPISSSADERINNTTIIVYKDEAIDVTVSVDATLTGLTLLFKVTDNTDTDVLTILNANITRTANTFTVNIPSTFTDELASHTWSLRDVTGATNTVLARGPFEIQNAP